MNSVAVTFTWCQEVSQYGDKLLRRLNEFRKKNMFYDVTLKAVDAELAAHKVVLAACGGMFRSHFIDPNTKKILGSVEEVSFACPAAGLRSILKFAYSGFLEINEKNLFPTLLAANVTDMKEVQDICSDIALSRLGWILKFDGTEDTIPILDSEGKLIKNGQDSISLSIEDVYEILFKLIEVNTDTFTEHFQIFLKNPILKIDTDKNSSQSKYYPCLEKIEKRWPHLVLSYKGIVQCVRYLHNIKFPEVTQISDNTKTKDERTETNVDTPITSSSPSLDSKIDKDTGDAVKKTPVIRHERQSSSDNRQIKIVTTPEVEKPTKSASLENVSKPVTKPRKSFRENVKNLSSEKVELTRATNLSPAKQSSLKTPVKPTSAPPQPGAAPIPRKKHAAPKPPGPPPTSASKTPSQMKNHVASPSGESKNPPPRPKPPSLKKNSKEAADSANYDDSLNPFADDDVDDDIVDDTVTGQTSAYDDSLNPFG